MARFSNSGSVSSTSGLPGSTYTVLFWYYLVVDTNSWQEFVRHTAGTSHFFETRVDGTNLTFSGGSGEVGTFASSLATWYCAAAVVSGTSVTVYHGTAPGALSSASGSCSTLSSPSSVVVGNAVNGRMNDLKIYSAALTEAEIIAELSQYQPVRTAGLLRWHPLIGDLVDYSGGGANLSGSGATVEDGPPIRWGRTGQHRVGLSGPKIIAPLSIPTAESVGIPTFRQIIRPVAVPTAESVGIPALGAVMLPASIPSAESVGVPTIIRLGTIALSSVPSAASIGVPLLVPGSVTIFPLSVPSAESVGVPKVKIVLDVTTLTPRDRQRRTPIYELLAVRRIPAASGPPTFLDVDRIKWSSLTWSSTLSRRQELSATVPTTSLTEAVVQLLRDPDHLPCELLLLRNGSAVFAGPLLGGEQRGRDVVLTAGGLLTYLEWMIVEQPLSPFVQVDQFTIAATLINQWQALEFGHFGIDTSQVGTSGRLRDRTYDREEIHPVDRRLAELGALRDGFDFEINPTTRALQLWHPGKGVDRSSGETAIVFDGRAGDAQDGLFSVAPGDLASEGYGSGSTAASETTMWSHQPNLELRAAFGRTAAAGSWSDVSEQATLDNHVAALRDARAATLRAPGRKVRVTPSADLSAYDVGDTVSYQLDAILRIGGAYRLRSRTVNVDAARQESVDHEFV